MVYQGKASKGCLPCRERRTKCDLALPSCNQCLRKKRVCTGYRQEEDLVFRTVTPQVGKRAKARNKAPSTSLALVHAPERAVVPHRSGLSVQRPSRMVDVPNEASRHFMAHFDEKFFFGRAGMADYLTPVLEADKAKGGPLSDIIVACGLATLGSMKNSPDLVTKANVKKTQVLRQLQMQLQDPKEALSHSSVLTCLLLGSFESLSCSGPEMMYQLSEHLKGAVVLVRLRGRSQLYDKIGLSLYFRMRGMIIMQCLHERSPLPDFIVEFTKDDEIAKRDFEAPFIRLLVRTCQLLAAHKAAGYLDDDMVIEVKDLMREWSSWRPREEGEGFLIWPPPATARFKTNPEEVQHLVWLAMAYLNQQGNIVILSDLLIDYAIQESNADPGPMTAKKLNDAMNNQVALCATLKDGVNRHLYDLTELKMAMRSMGGHSLLWPISVLLTVKTISAETFGWSLAQAMKIADVFGLKQAAVFVDMMLMAARAASEASPGTSEGGKARKRLE